uniref:Ribosomal protein L34 n=1 Tax=Pseudellipsoidion edaphicum TaxID=1431838 RepID=A0A410D2S7_9STRA|nr:ribosomal protein L34 [Pseudellipsoidion edaphicum]QAA12030.1 ribosomal protein L34 [Pseudellipsoidion edaphicum]
MTKRTLEGTNRKSLKKSGFRARMKTKNGQNIINARRKKNRTKLAKPKHK